MPWVVQLIGDMELVAMVVEVGSWRLINCGELLGLGGVRVCWWGPVWARLIVELEVVGWGPVVGCWWRVRALIVQICRQRAVGPLDGWSCRWLRICGSAQVRGWWVPRLMTMMEAEAEGGLLMECWWLLVLEDGWPW